MRPQRTISEPIRIQDQDIPMLDGEFDRFELNNDLEANLREAEAATFYHDALDLEE